MRNHLRIGAWEFAPDLHELRRGGVTVHLEPKHAGVLSLLAGRPGELFTREEILARVWGDVHVTEEVLTNAIYQLRKLFEDDARSPRVIQTIPRKGYRLIAEARPVAIEERAVPRIRRAAVAGVGVVLLSIPLALAIFSPSSVWRAGTGLETAAADAALEEGTVEGAILAIEIYDRLLESNTDFAPALAGRSRARLMLVSAGAVASELAYPAIESDAMSAIRIDPEAPAGHLALGVLRTMEWEWKAAERHLRRGVALDPESGLARASLAEFLLLSGRKEEARAEANRATALEPESPRVLLAAGFVHTMLRDRAAAEEAYRAILVRRPEHEHARQQLEKLAQPTVVEAPLDRDQLIVRIDELLGKGRVRPAIVAGMFAEAGESEKALEWLRRARNEKDVSLLLVRLDDRWERLHGDPRFRAILADAGPR